MKTKTILYIIFFLLSACSIVKSSNKTTAPVTLSASTTVPITPTIESITPTKIEISTITPLPTSSTTPLVTPSPTPMQPTTIITKQCINEISSESKNILSSGSILYYSPKKDSIMSFPMNAINPLLILPGIANISVSPFSGTYLSVTTSGVYDVITSDDKYYQVNHNPAWGYHRQWLLDDRLIIGHLPVEHPEVRKAKDDVYILTLSTGKYEHLQLDLPEYFAFNGGDGMIAKPVYDPTGNFVAYGWDNQNTLVSGMLLWDIKNKEEVWKRSGWEWDPLSDNISWQYDGSHVFIVAPSIGKEHTPEIFSIDREGDETQLSNLGEVFTPTYYLINDLVISPDGKKIALSIDTNVPSPSNLYSLYVFDIQTGELIDYCVTVNQSMVWSPMSDQLAFISEPVWGEPQLLVLDINSGKAMAIDDHTRGLFGWVNWSPP